MLYDHPIRLPFELEFDASSAGASRARQAARIYLDQERISSKTAADLELVVSELAANAVQQQPDEPVRLTVTVQLDGVQIRVTNAATSHSLPVTTWRRSKDEVTNETRERGWGLEIVESLTDSLICENAEGWTSVVCFRRFD
ncbi:MAG: ATP-binding protein [Acidobacteriota bacterium]